MEGDDGLRQLSEIQLEQGGHCVHICVTVEKKNGGEQDGRLRSLFIVARRHGGKHKSSWILRATGVTGGQRREDNVK